MEIQFIVVTLLLLLVSQPFYAQLVEGRENRQTTPQEVKASAITEGGFSGDVSLFTGTYNSSYQLGSVSTYSGDIKSLFVDHVYHVIQARPDLIKFLSIPVGYRFYKDSLEESSWID